MRTKYIPVLIAAAASLIPASKALAANVYVSYANGNFGTISLTDGSFNLIAATDPVFFGMGLNATGVLTGLTDTGDLYDINTTTGAATFVESEGVEVEGAGSNSAGTLYFSQFNTQGDNLYTAPGAALIGNPGVPSDGLDAFGPGNVLYIDGFTGGADTLYSVNPSNGDLTSGGASITGDYGSTPYNAQIFTGVFNDGVLYGFGEDNVSDNFNIYTINPTTGAATFVTPYGNSVENAIDGVALGTPEPSTPLAFVLGTLSLLTLIIAARRRKLAVSSRLISEEHGVI
jgi:hypothetical protein